MAIIRFFLVYAAVLAVCLPNSFHGWGLLVAMFLAIFIPTDLFDMVLVVGYRQKIVKYIQEHGQEIRSVV